MSGGIRNAPDFATVASTMFASTSLNSLSLHAGVRRYPHRSNFHLASSTIRSLGDPISDLQQPVQKLVPTSSIMII
jgi:hypothetical protein